MNRPNTIFGRPIARPKACEAAIAAHLHALAQSFADAFAAAGALLAPQEAARIGGARHLFNCARYLRGLLGRAVSGRVFDLVFGTAERGVRCPAYYATRELVCGDQYAGPPLSEGVCAAVGALWGEAAACLAALAQADEPGLRDDAVAGVMAAYAAAEKIAAAAEAEASAAAMPADLRRRKIMASVIAVETKTQVRRRIKNPAPPAWVDGAAVLDCLAPAPGPWGELCRAMSVVADAAEAFGAGLELGARLPGRPEALYRMGRVLCDMFEAAMLASAAPGAAEVAEELGAQVRALAAELADSRGGGALITDETSSLWGSYLCRGPAEAAAAAECLRFLAGVPSFQALQDAIPAVGVLSNGCVPLSVDFIMRSVEEATALARALHDYTTGPGPALCVVTTVLSQAIPMSLCDPLSYGRGLYPRPGDSCPGDSCPGDSCPGDSHPGAL